MILIPADPLRPRRPDEHFAPEAAAATAAGIPVALVDHDALTRPGGAAAAVARVPEAGVATYRGWMVGAARYADLAAALAARDVALRTAPERYRRAHELPGWYPALAGLTPASVWTDGTDRAAFEDCCRRLGPGPAVLRDYVKSMKHHWDEAMYVPDTADPAGAWRVAEAFLRLREDDLVGGLVLRRYERFASPEVRSWWVDGACRLLSAHPDTPDDLPPDTVDVPGLEAAMATLDLRFATADLVRRDDGRWRVVEVGDGQVSDRPASLPPDRLLAALP
jgi:hypothetical protein